MILAIAAVASVIGVTTAVCCLWMYRKYPVLKEAGKGKR